jgi:hypothetical protein
MPYIILIAVVGVLLLQVTGAIPPDPVGGGIVIAAVTFVAALAIGMHEAWTKRRGVLGWIVNIVVTFFGAFFAAQIAGPVVAIPLLILVGGGASSLAAAGSGVMSIAIVLMMVAALLGSWGAILLVNRWRDRPKS